MNDRMYIDGLQGAGVTILDALNEAGMVIMSPSVKIEATPEMLAIVKQLMEAAGQPCLLVLDAKPAPSTIPEKPASAKKKATTGTKRGRRKTVAAATALPPAAETPEPENEPTPWELVGGDRNGEKLSSRRLSVALQYGTLNPGQLITHVKRGMHMVIQVDGHKGYTLARHIEPAPGQSEQPEPSTPVVVSVQPAA